MRPRRVQVGNQVLDGLELDFKVKSEQWSEYELLDGGTVRMKTTALRIVRVLDPNGKPAYTADGDPQLVVNHNTQIVSREGS